MSTGTKRKILAPISTTISTSTGESSSSEIYSRAKRSRPHETVPRPEVERKVSLWQCNLPGLKKYSAHPVFLPYSPDHNYRNSDSVHHYRVAYYQFQEMAKTSNSAPFHSREIKNVKDSIQSVTYIDNKENSKKFEAQRKLFALQGKLGPGGEVEERLMFHGTTEDSLARLLEENFDLDSVPLQVVPGGQERRLRSKATVYGRGVYFSGLPRVSLMYGDVLVLCRVLPGSSQTVAPLSPGSPVLPPIPAQSDSRVVRRAGGPGDLVVVVRSPTQVLPYCVIKLLPGCLAALDSPRPSPAVTMSWSWTKVEMSWQCGLGGRARKEVALQTVRRHSRSLQAPGELEEVGRSQTCTICLDSLGPATVSLLQCGHTFHSSCLVRLVEAQTGQHHLRCPNCQTIHGVRTGNMPTTGSLRYATHQGRSLPGYPGEGVIVVEYQFKDGIQDETQPRPGKPFYARGFPRAAFLPGTSQGHRVLHQLITAFKRGLTFTIGPSVTTGEPDCLTWNGIHHKTMGPGHTYPDMGYLDRVMLELKLNGVEG